MSTPESSHEKDIFKIADLITDERLAEMRAKHDKSYKKITILEKKFPWFTRISKHPTYGHWVPVLFAVGEVALSFLAIGLFAFLIPKIPFPLINIPLPDIPFPRIPFPDINLPDIPFPELPVWLEAVLYWLRRTWVVWIAVLFAVLASRKKRGEDISEK